MIKNLKYLFVALSVGTTASFGASFDCTKASNKIEHLICEDDELSILDEHLLIAYRNAKKHIDSNVLKNEQRQWIKNRNQCRDISCLQKSYSQRLTTSQRS